MHFSVSGLYLSCHAYSCDVSVLNVQVSSQSIACTLEALIWNQGIIVGSIIPSSTDRQSLVLQCKGSPKHSVVSA